MPLRALANAVLSAGNTTDLAALNQTSISLSPAQAGAPVFPNILTAPIPSVTLFNLAMVANECRDARRTRWWSVQRFAHIVQKEVRDQNWADRMDLDAALDRLPQHHIAVLSLYYHLDLPIDEVARVLGCSEGAARQRIHRALAALRPVMTLETNG